MESLLDTFGIDVRLLIVQTVNFGLLLLVLWHFLYRPFMRMLDERQKKIEEGVRNADAADAKLKALDEERTSILKATHAEAEHTLLSAKKHAEETEAALTKEAHKKSERILHDAEARARDTKERALAESKKEVTQKAILAAEAILRDGKKDASHA